MEISFTEATRRFSNRTDIVLIEKEYYGWSKTAKFFDIIENDFFMAIPRNVKKYNSGHPKRGEKKRKETYIKKYGADNCLKSKEIQEKIKKTNLLKYGVDNAMKNKLIKQKANNTLLMKYGVDNSAKLSSNRFIVETGEHLTDWYQNQPDPKPGYSTLIHVFKNERVLLSDIEMYFKEYKINKTLPEIKMKNLLSVEYFNLTPNSNVPYRPDFKISDNVFVNVDGLYWHSEKIQTNKNYHFQMRECFEKNNLRILQFRENELFYKENIVKSIIENSIGKINKKIYGRKCQIKTVDQKMANSFLIENHLMGATKAKHVGLYFNNNLVSLLSYKQKKNICKIERFCSTIGTNVIGAFSKLLNYVECNLLKPETIEIHNWVDLRYGTGKHLESKGFKLIKETLGWQWTDYKNTFNRLKCRANMNKKNLTERQQAEELKWFKIYDAGQRLYRKIL